MSHSMSQLLGIYQILEEFWIKSFRISHSRFFGTWFYKILSADRKCKENIFIVQDVAEKHPTVAYYTNNRSSFFLVQRLTNFQFGNNISASSVPRLDFQVNQKLYAGFATQQESIYFDQFWNTLILYSK